MKAHADALDRLEPFIKWRILEKKERPLDGLCVEERELGAFLLMLHPQDANRVLEEDLRDCSCGHGTIRRRVGKHRVC